MIIACHQPNYLPWLGYFHKIANSDVFVLFDDVQIPNGKNFGTRISIKTSNGVLDLTIPILNRGDGILIKDAKMADKTWQKKHLKSIILSYQKAPYFKQYIGEIESIYNFEWENLCDFNITLIKLIIKFLGIKTKLVLSSELGVYSTGEQRIIEMVKKLGGDTYLSGIGAGSKRYIREEDFKKEGIKLKWQDFIHPVYPQLYGEFIPNLSVIDYLFNNYDSMR